MPGNGYNEKELLINKNWCFGFARVRTVLFWIEESGINIPPNFHHCREPPYENGCPIGVITHDRENGIALHNSNLCIGCKL